MKSTLRGISPSRHSPGMPAGGSGSRFRIANWTVDPDTCRISGNSKRVKLEPKVMDVLVFLAARPGEVVSREMLETAVWPGTIVGYDTVTGAIQKLRRAFDDNPQQPRIIETLSKRGYRLIAPVISLIEPGPAAGLAAEPIQPAAAARAGPTLISLALIALLLLAFITMIWLRPWANGVDEGGEPAGNPKSIAVLPFENIGGEQDRDYFADGVTDDLITQLSKISDFFVIARDSAFVYKGRSVGIREIAQRLGVSYLVSGSIRQEAAMVRINARLIDAVQGNNIWAESYDGSAVELLRLQDRIISDIVAALATRLNASEREELGRPQTNNAEARDSFLQGRQRFFNYANKEENQKARELFAKAVGLDPEFAIGYAMLAWTHAFDAMNGWADNRSESLLRARELAGHALSLDEKLPLAHFVTGLTYREKGEYIKALVEAEKAISLDPNYANAHVLTATLLYYAGRPEEGIERIKKAIMLNPHHPYNYSFHLGQAYFILRRYPEAIETFERGLASNPASERLRVWLAAAYAQNGESEEAEWQVEQVLMLNPSFSSERMEEVFPFSDPADLKHFQLGLRQAGFPD